MITHALREQTRARYPDEEGYVERDGVRVFWEAYGSGERTVVLLPTWSIVHSRHWKLQIPYFARHCRVVTFDGRGNGRSDRPAGIEPYLEDEFAADTLAVMDAAGADRATLGRRLLRCALGHDRRRRPPGPGRRGRLRRACRRARSRAPRAADVRLRRRVRHR